MARQNWQAGNMLYPLPAVMVSCQRPEEKPNIITVAWTGTICSTPAMVSISVRPERYSYDIIKETGEFVINLTTEKLTYATDFCGVRSGRDIDKFKAAHLTPIPGVHVSAPLIEESPVNIECRVKDVIELGSPHYDPPGSDHACVHRGDYVWKSFPHTCRSGRESESRGNAFST